jgi:hypothetical protein
MKRINTTHKSVLILILEYGMILSSQAYAWNEHDSLHTNIASDTSRNIKNCFFIALGWGIPQGGRIEIGQYMSSNIFAGGTFSINDQWSNDRSGGRVGVILGSLLTPSESDIRPFILGSAGETFVIIGKSEYYLLCHLGLKVPSSSLVQIQPEAGIDMTFKNDVSGTLKRQTWFGFNISMLVVI